MNMSYDDGTMGLLSPFSDGMGFRNPNAGGGIDWNSVINQGFGVGSQAIGAWGRNPTQQVGAGGQPIGGGYTPAAINASQAQIQAAIGQQNQNALLGRSGSQGGTGIDSAVSNGLAWAQQNWYIIVGGLVAWKLFTADPAKSRR